MTNMYSRTHSNETVNNLDQGDLTLYNKNVASINREFSGLNNELEVIKLNENDNRDDIDAIYKKMNKIKSDILKINRVDIDKKIDDEVDIVKQRFNLFDHDTQQRLEELEKLKEEINAQFTRLQPWLDRLGSFLYDILTAGQIPNVPQSMKRSPALWLD